MKVLPFACVLGCCLLGGCLSSRTSGVAVEKGRVEIHDPSFALNLEIVRDACERTPEGFLHVQATIRNLNNSDFRCQYRFEWKNAQGLVQTHAMMPWRPVVIHGHDETVFEAVSPLKDTEDFRLSVRRSNP